MKIDGNKPNIDNKTILNDKKVDNIKTENNKRTVISSDISSDRVNLSSKARDFHKIAEVIKHTPDIREERVNELKEAIEKGTYKADSKKIAEKMILESLE
jgi:flagellar biosynthesis anti-sigma factor FlgM